MLEGVSVPALICMVLGGLLAFLGDSAGSWRFLAILGILFLQILRCMCGASGEYHN